jgi:hypothetical protein
MVPRQFRFRPFPDRRRSSSCWHHHLGHAKAQACAGEAETPHPDKNGVLVDLRFRCPATARSITYRNRLFHEFDAAAVQNVLVLAGDDIDQAVLTHTRNVLDLTGERPRFGTVLGR